MWRRENRVLLVIFPGRNGLCWWCFYIHFWNHVVSIHSPYCHELSRLSCLLNNWCSSPQGCCQSWADVTHRPSSDPRKFVLLSLHKEGYILGLSDTFFSSLLSFVFSQYSCNNLYKIYLMCYHCTFIISQWKTFKDY